MAPAEPTTSNTTETLDQEPPFLKFPPFPPPPSGVAIMPFKDFRPRGIQLFSEPKKGKDGLSIEDDDDAELDALGIPTVELRIKHATDECKSNSRKKRKKKKTAASVAEPPVKKLPWYEEWEEGEDLRVTKVRYDANTSPIDRFFQAAFDFRTGRPWPPVSSGLNNLWDQFRLFTGLLVNPSVVRKTGGKKNARAESPDFESDEENDPVMNIGSDTPTNARPVKRSRPDDGLDSDDEDSRDPHKLDEEVRDEKISVFLSDPEKAVRIFLSSYMREHGLVWAERNLVNTPRLVSFFLAFILRNRVLLEPEYQRGLKRALEMIEGAKKELPLTHTVGQAMPDAFNEACREYFGRKGGMNWLVAPTIPNTTEQADASITVTDISNRLKTDIVLPTEAEIQLKDAIEDNMDVEISLDTSSANVVLMDEDAGNSWANGWGDEWGKDGAWDKNGRGEVDPWADENQEGQTPGETVTDAKWADSNPTWKENDDPASLFSLLGPSVLPLTHTTGIVECSTRRVIAIHFPPGHPKSTCPPSLQEIPGRMAESRSLGWAPSALGVEEELDTRFAKVVLEPWGREEGDISSPEIWNTSRGPVIDPKKPSESKVSTDSGCKPHNPLTDTITLLVAPSFAEVLALVPGLGLGAMWIEIVRKTNSIGSDGLSEVDTTAAGRFWYHEDVMGIFPSFYVTRTTG